MGLIRWLADQIQSTTGEKERRERTARMHDLADEFKEKVSAAVAKLNTAISKFNDRIRKLNSVRAEKIKDNIVSLYGFLKKYGNCKPMEEYRIICGILIGQMTKFSGIHSFARRSA